jgi:Xaa-Pro dipeptidase
VKLHFTYEEFRGRERRTLGAMQRERLDAVLLFNPESHYWLTGYDTFGYCFFQCLVLTADGRKVLLTRSADLRQAKLTSLITDVRIWKDGADARPVATLRALCGELGLDGKRLGVEWASKGLDAAAGRALADAFDGVAALADASYLVTRLRLVKSRAELAYVRRAGALADAALGAALEATGPGADEARIQAALTGAVYAGDGDDTGNPPIVGSGPYALLCRSHTGRRRLDDRDQLTLEWAGAYRRYHAAQMRTVCVGAPTPRHRELFDAAHEALLACEARLRPGYTVGEIYDAHTGVLDALGLAEHRLNACGYALGAVYAPAWMDWPMVYEGNPVVLEPDMVFFLHMILMDGTSGTAMTLGRTSIVTDGAPEPASSAPLELLVR